MRLSQRGLPRSCLNPKSNSLVTHVSVTLAEERLSHNIFGQRGRCEIGRCRSHARIKGESCHDDANGYTGWLQTIPVNVLRLGTPGPWPELGTDRVSNRYERRLRHLLIRDPEHCGSVAFVGQVQCRPCCSQAPGAGGEHETPGRGQYRSPRYGLPKVRSVFIPAFDARDDQDRHLLEVLSQVGGGLSV